MHSGPGQAALEAVCLVVELPENEYIIEQQQKQGIVYAERQVPLNLVKPSSYSSRLDVYALIRPFFIRRKI
jgi:hypothetical protein